jgi:hypothetical protein
MRVLEQISNNPVSNKVNNGDSDSRAASKRRSSRVVIEMPVTVFGQSLDRKMFHEHTKTITVSAHGALLSLRANIDAVRPVLIVNPRTQSEAQCRVAYRKDLAGGVVEIGLEFSTSLPKFWGIHFPPEDWDPAERKRPASVQRSAFTPVKGSKR